MPLYSELYHNFVGNTPIIPSPMVSVGSSTYSPPTYVGVSRAFPNPLSEELKKAAGGAATLAPDTLEERLKEALEQQLAQDSGVEVAEKRKLKKIKRTRTKVLPVASVAGADVEAPPEPKREEEEAVVVVENAVAPRIVAELESIEECTVFKLPKKKKKQQDEGGPATGPGGARKDVPEVQVVIRDQPEPNGAQGPSKQASTAGASEATVDGAGPVDATTPRKTAKTGIKTYVRKKTVEALPEPVQVETVKLVAEPEGKVKVEPTSNGLAKSIEMPPLQKIQAMDRSVDMGEKPAAKKQSDIPAKLGDDKSSEEVKRCVEGSSVTTVDSSQAKLPERKVPTTEAIKLVTSEKQEVTPKQTAQSIEVKKMPSSDPPIPKQPESLANLAKKPTMPLQTDGKVPRTTTEALKLVNNAKQEVAPKQAAQLPEVKKIPPSEPPSPKQPESPASLAKKPATLVQPDSKTSATVTPTIARTDQQPTNELISKLSQTTKPKLEQLPAEPANKSPLTKPKLDETPAKLAPAKLGLVRKKPADLKRSTDEVDFWSTIGTRETVSFARRKQQLVALRSTEEEESPPASPSQPYQGMPGSPKVGLVGRSKLQEAQLVGSPKSPTEGKSVFTLPDPKAAEESAIRSRKEAGPGENQTQRAKARADRSHPATGTTVPVTTTATAGPTTDGKQPDEPPTKKVIAKKVVKVVKTKVTAGSKPKPEPEADVQAEREQEQRRLAQQQQQQQQNLERMKTKLNQITLNMGVKGMEVEVKECQKCQSAIVYEALPVPAAIVTTPKMTPAPPSATSKQPSANGAKLTKNKFGTLANLSDLSAVDGRDRHTTQAVQSKQKPQTPTEQQQQQQKVFLSSSDEENGEAAKQRPAAGVSVGARVANDSASETSFSGVEDDWSSEEEDDEDDEMANDKPEKKKPFDPTKRVKLNFEQMRKCYSKEEKSPIVLVARPRPLWKVKRHGHRHNRKADLTSSSSSGSGSSSCSEDESTSTSTTTSSGATTSTTGRTSSEAVSTMDGATSDIATDSSVNSSTGGKQGKGAKGAQAKGKGAKGKPDPFGDIYDNPMVIPLHAEPRTSSRKSGGSFVAPLRDENNNTPADLDEDERARSIGAGHEVRSASTSSHDSGFYGGGTAPISPKKALATMVAAATLIMKVKFNVTVDVVH
uniref:Uncharacterized protein n=1 Tax=Anopheles coluzzii TaxID=1518534 RepID=A0A8W7PPJ3_ANOCL